GDVPRVHDARCRRQRTAVRPHRRVAAPDGAADANVPQRYRESRLSLGDCDRTLRVTRIPRVRVASVVPTGPVRPATPTHAVALSPAVPGHRHWSTRAQATRVPHNSPAAAGPTRAPSGTGSSPSSPGRRTVSQRPLGSRVATAERNPATHPRLQQRSRASDRPTRTAEHVAPRTRPPTSRRTPP